MLVLFVDDCEIKTSGGIRVKIKLGQT